VRAFDAIEVLTFDCYGTLIDWESGILGALRPLLRRHGHTISDTWILERYARLESEAQSGTFRPYRDVLRRVADAFASHFGFAANEDERRSLERSLADWEPFPDTVAALESLAKRYQLGVFSNVDDDLFQATAARLGVALDHLVTAQRVGAYKPAPEFFRRALRQVAAPQGSILHVAQSLYHDIAPAQRLGLSTVWVNRRHGRGGFGATVPSSAQADLEVPDLRGLVSALGR
jgi:2-haloacid dehalogenase